MTLSIDWVPWPGPRSWSASSCITVRGRQWIIWGQAWCKTKKKKNIQNLIFWVQEDPQEFFPWRKAIGFLFLGFLRAHPKINNGHPLTCNIFCSPICLIFSVWPYRGLGKLSTVEHHSAQITIWSSLACCGMNLSLQCISNEEEKHYKKSWSFHNVMY